MGKGAAGLVDSGVSFASDRFAAVKEKASALGDRAGDSTAGSHFDFSRLRGSAMGFLVFVFYLCGYFCWFAAMVSFWKSEYRVLWDDFLPKAAYNAVAAGSFIAAISALALAFVVPLREGTCTERLTAALLKWLTVGLCVVHIVGAIVFMGGMGSFIHNDNKGTPMYAGKSSGQEVLGITTRQLLMPVFSSICLVYLCVVLVTGREIPAVPATCLLSAMTWWLYLCGFFIEFSKKGSDGGGSAAGVAAGSFIASIVAPIAAVVSAAAPLIPLEPEQRGLALHVLTAAHFAGYFVFFCSSCAWLHHKFSTDDFSYSYLPSQNLADVTLFIFMPSFFSLYFVARLVRQANALRQGYSGVTVV